MKTVYRKRRRRRRIRKMMFLGMAAIVLLLAVRMAVFAGSGTKNVSVMKNLYSTNAILLQADTGKCIGEKNSGEKIYPASLTKIMTVLLALEKLPDLDMVTTVPPSIYDNLYNEGASMAGFLPGEDAKIRDLLYGAMLPSGAECCLTLAEVISGSEEAFVEEMNKRARELGMDKTHFSNCTGLWEEEHYSTVEDISVLLLEALKSSRFRDIFTSEVYSTEPSGLHPQGFTFYSTLFTDLSNPDIPGGRILGGKTGYTSRAGLCLASLAQVDGKEYILVTAHAKGSHDTEPNHIRDARKVYEAIKNNLDR